MELAGKASEEIYIASPFISTEGVGMLMDATKPNRSIKITVITNLSVHNIVEGVTNPAAILQLFNQYDQVNVSSLGRLHAKAYLMDDAPGIITSANLTRGGLCNNFEYGVQINNKDTVKHIKEDMNKYYTLGNIFDKRFLETIAEASSELCTIKRKANNQIKKSRLARLLRNNADALTYKLQENRVAKNRTIHSIFQDTIVYLLQKTGPLLTVEMQPLIQAIHPDICDDSIDRVINGQRFGKKWKHAVRNAQQSLKKNKVIFYDNTRWHLC